MMIGPASHVRLRSFCSTENLKRPKCPRCGSVLLVAERSHFNLSGHIDHVWSCDDCGKEFMTSIRLRSSLSPQFMTID
jgi:DNA-directed RNA polymerase subunit RPC12/RpoP